MKRESTEIVDTWRESENRREKEQNLVCASPFVCECVCAPLFECLGVYVCACECVSGSK